MSNWSLICFSLAVQSAFGLAWVGLAGHWFGPQPGPLRPVVIALLLALALTGLGLAAALAHLSKPRLAPQALRNLAHSWLSREVVLVQVFAGAIVLVLAAMIFGSGPWLVAGQVLVCLAGLAALTAMTKVYLLKTVPAWNSPATPLEFGGSALVLGGVLGALLGTIQNPGWSPALCAAGTSLALGLIMKLAAIGPAFAAAKAARNQTWYRPPTSPFSLGRVVAIRQGLNLAGLGMALAASAAGGPAWLWLGLALGCLAAGETLGRWHFYRSFGRLGL